MSIIIFVAYGVRKNDETNFVEMIKAFYTQKEADDFCGNYREKKENPFRYISWQTTKLGE